MNLLNFAVLLVCVLLIHGEELSDECRNEMLIKSYEADNCFDKIGSPQVLMAEFNETVLNYCENEVNFQDVESLVNKICAIIPQYYECAMMVFDISSECPRDSKVTLRKVFLDDLASFSDYACDNDGEMIKNLIPHNGLKYFFLNDDFDKCAAIVQETENISELCSAINRAYSCAVEVIGDHPNKDIMVFAWELTSQFKQSAKC